MNAANEEKATFEAHRGLHWGAAVTKAMASVP